MFVKQRDLGVGAVARSSVLLVQWLEAYFALAAADAQKASCVTS